MQESKEKRVVIFFWDGWISVSPSIMNCMLLLAKQGYKVDCICNHYPGKLADEISFPDTVTIYRHGIPGNGIGEAKGFKQPARPGPARRFFLNVKSALGVANMRTKYAHGKSILNKFNSYVAYANTIVSKHRYDMGIGVDMYGLAAAGKLMDPKKVQLVYFSLEIRFLNEFKYRAEKAIKLLERKYHRLCRLTIIQDRYRMNALFRENGVVPSEENTHIVPNSTIGTITPPQSTYFKDLFGFSTDDIIVLNAGGLSQGYLNEEIAAASAQWPGHYKLVFHFTEFLTPDHPSIIKLRTLSNDKAYFSLTPVAFDKLSEITASAHIGIVFYNKERGLNHSLIVGASGKLSNYLRTGLPVVALDLPGFKELFDAYGCGVVVSHPDETRNAIDRILTDRARYSENALRCFAEAYEFEKYFNRIFEKVR
jgi:hypothetical protein